MEPEITPEPTEDERRAILAALDGEAPFEPEAYRSRWREAALEEGATEDALAEPRGSTFLE
jgi:hypothetical protein